MFHRKVLPKRQLAKVQQKRLAPQKAVQLPKTLAEAPQNLEVQLAKQMLKRPLKKRKQQQKQQLKR